MNIRIASRQKWVLVRAALAALLATGVGIVSIVPAHATGTTTGCYMAASGANLNPARHYTPKEIEKLAAAAHGSVSGCGMVQPFDVASGYILFNPGYKRDAYNYDSDWGNLTYEYCSSTCTVLDKWQSQVHEWVQGGSAKSWALTMNARRVSGTDSVYFDYWYACAINVSGSPDHYCSSAHGADVTPESAAMNPGERIFRYFERNNYSNTEYPMVGITIHFPNGYSAENKDRMADVCVTATTSALCAVTGTGTSPSTHRW